MPDAASWGSTFEVRSRPRDSSDVGHGGFRAIHGLKTLKSRLDHRLVVKPPDPLLCASLLGEAGVVSESGH